MPICLTTAHWKSSGMVSSKRFKLDCSSSVVLFFSGYHHWRRAIQLETLGRNHSRTFSVCCSKANGHWPFHLISPKGDLTLTGLTSPQLRATHERHAIGVHTPPCNRRLRFWPAADRRCVVTDGRVVTLDSSCELTSGIALKKKERKKNFLVLKAIRLGNKANTN